MLSQYLKYLPVKINDSLSPLTQEGFAKGSKKPPGIYSTLLSPSTGFSLHCMEFELGQVTLFIRSSDSWTPSREQTEGLELLC